MNKSLVAMLLGSAFSTNVAFASDYEILSAANAQSASSGVKIAGSFSSCEVIPGIAVNSTKPDLGGWGFDIFPKKLIDTLEPNVDGREFVDELTPTLRVYSPPKHGVIDDYTRGYKPKPGFEGIDTAYFSFKYKGKTYLSIQKFVVSIPRDDKPLPLNCKDAWKLLKRQKHSLLENGSDPAISFTSWSQLQNMTEMLALLSAASGVSYSFTTLSGSAVGTTTGEGLNAQITLDSDAAGHGGYIDPTPLDSADDFLPTSNPNEWVAKDTATLWAPRAA